MAGLVKIGKTDNLEKRIKGLDSTGVPLPFRCYYAAEVDNANLLEKKLHRVFTDQRVRHRREFFRIDPDQVKEAISIASAQFIKEVTPKEDIFSEAADGPALKKTMQFKDKKLHFKITDLGIPVGTILQFARDISVTCEVVSDYKVDYEGKTLSLSAAALKAYKKLGYKWSAANGLVGWMYAGKTLSYRRMLREREDEEKEEVIENDSNQTIAKIRDKMIEALNRKYQVTLSRRTMAEHIDKQTGTAVRLMISKRYGISNSYDYWYTLNTKQIKFLMSVKQGYVFLGFADKKSACLVPIAVMDSLFTHCGTTESEDSTAYHLFIRNEGSRTFAFYFSKTGKEYDLSKYIISFN